jgi:hypothetical protein
LLSCVLENEKLFGQGELKLSLPDNIYSLIPVPKFMVIVAIVLGVQCADGQAAGTERSAARGESLVLVLIFMNLHSLRYFLTFFILHRAF